MGKCYLRCSANAVNSESVLCGDMDLFSAKGAVSCSSLGSAQDPSCGARNPALKTRFNPVDAFLIPNKLVSDVNRAFSAGSFFCHVSWGGAPGSQRMSRLWR